MLPPDFVLDVCRTASLPDRQGFCRPRIRHFAVPALDRDFRHEAGLWGSTHGTRNPCWSICGGRTIEESRPRSKQDFRCARTLSITMLWRSVWSDLLGVVPRNRVPKRPWNVWNQRCHALIVAGGSRRIRWRTPTHHILPGVSPTYLIVLPWKCFSRPFVSWLSVHSYR